MPRGCAGRATARPPAADRPRRLGESEHAPLTAPADLACRPARLAAAGRRRARLHRRRAVAGGAVRAGGAAGRPATASAGRATPTCRSTSTACSGSRRWRCAGPWGGRPTWSRWRRPPATSPAACSSTTSTSPATRSTPAAATSTGSARLGAGRPPDRVRARRLRPRLSRPARAAVLDVLRVQRLEQPARGRLGDDPAQLPRRRPPRQALTQLPTEVGYSQHTGGEKAAWGDEKLQVVDGTHPTVYPADGSHANFFDAGAVPGRLGRAGRRLRRHPRTPGWCCTPTCRRSPATPPQAQAQFPWIGFQGRWGEQQPAFFNGPTGPNLKTQWTQPIRWSQDWRDRSYAVPAGGALGTRTTDFFCAAMAAGSRLLWVAVSNPAPTVAAVLAVLLLLVWALRRATLAADGAAAAGAPPRLGPDPDRAAARMYVVAPAAVRRHRPAAGADLAGDHAAPGAASDRHQRARHRRPGRPAPACWC